MEKMDVEVEFLTPTFLGGDEQQAELRSAPFKNLLRQWWRVAHGDKSLDELRDNEGKLFGTVHDENNSSASSVRIALRPGDPFDVRNDSFNFGKTFHPEAKGGISVDNDLYLGYGPIQLKKEHKVYKEIKRYIVPCSRALLTVSFPREFRDQVIKVLRLIDAFGTVGSRSRNGFGSLSLSGEGFQRMDLTTLNYRSLDSILGDQTKAYPHGFGGDTKPYIWQSAGQSSWDACMRLLAETYLKARVSINIKGNPHEPHERHALGYPVTNHNVQSWGGKQGRMPSQIRLMVKRNGAGDLVARILHLPHTLPLPWPNSLPRQEDVWRNVHKFLDGQGNFTRIGGGA